MLFYLKFIAFMVLRERSIIQKEQIISVGEENVQKDIAAGGSTGFEYIAKGG